MSVRAIRCDPLIRGGRPCIAGTRIPTRGPWSLWQAGYCIGQIARAYPGLTHEQVWDAILFERRRHNKEKPACERRALFNCHTGR